MLSLGRRRRGPRGCPALFSASGRGARLVGENRRCPHVGWSLEVTRGPPCSLHAARETTAVIVTAGLTSGTAVPGGGGLRANDVERRDAEQHGQRNRHVIP